MKVKYILLFLLGIFIQPVFAIPVSAPTQLKESDCVKYEKDQAKFSKDSSDYYFSFGMCEAALIHDEESFNRTIGLLEKATIISTNSSIAFQPQAYFLMGILYTNKYNSGAYLYGGQGKSKDLLNAIENYEKAASFGCSQAENNLGEIYLDEAYLSPEEKIKKDVLNKDASIQIPDVNKGISWLMTASKHGNFTAQGSLSYLYEKGIGVPQDYILAYVWKNISLAGNSRYNLINPLGEEHMVELNKANRDIRDKLYEKLTVLQKDKAQALLQDYTKDYLREPTPIDRMARSIQTYVAGLNIVKILGHIQES